MKDDKDDKYVTCNLCEWQLNNVPDRDWSQYPCNYCNNTRQVLNPKNILCNLCGECMCPLGTMNEQIPHGLYNAKVVGGYDSYHLFDMSQYTFSFCEKCLRNLFVKCKIKPKTNEVNFDGDSSEGRTWEEDHKAYEYRVWRDEGGHHQAYLNRKCNFIKDCVNAAVYTQLSYDEFTECCCCEEHKELFNYSNGKLTKFISNILKPFL